MANATTQKFEEMILETSEDGTTWTRLCGLIDVTVSRSANMDTAEVPDCDDESLPLSLEKQVRSIEVSVSATGVWAQESQGTLKDWFYSSASKRVRISDTGAASGETEIESGFAYLTSLETGRTKGQKVSASIEIMFDGTPSRTAAA